MGYIYKGIRDVVPGDVILHYGEVTVVVDKISVDGKYYKYKCTLSKLNSFSKAARFYYPYTGNALVRCLDI